MPRTTPILTFLPVILIFIFVGYGPNNPATRAAKTQDTLTVQRVIDGYTIELSDGRTVRLIGIDTPEFKNHERNRKNAEKFGIEFEQYESYAQKAKDFLSELVEAKEVRTEFDPINAITGYHNKYARFLAYLYVEDTFVNAEIIRQGYGLTYRKFQFRHREKFLEIEEAAKENGRGLWG